jgi:calcineurin-like phosphoesterase family protein
VDDGLPLICGHVHEAWRVRGRMLNVGVDVNDFTPVSQEQVAEEVRAMYRIPAE